LVGEPPDRYSAKPPVNASLGDENLRADRRDADAKAREAGVENEPVAAVDLQLGDELLR
jgi:hypothetical protein